MSAIPLSYFDRLAESYDQSWTNSLIGRLQRDAVWRELSPLVRPGDRVLDLGCGTGEDALHFQKLGAQVEAIDGSPRMVDAARQRGVPARLQRIEEVAALHGTFDLVLSNFGALNCVADLSALREPLRRLLRPEGVLAVCVLNRFCLWESGYYALRARLQKAVRRWTGNTQTSSGLRVFYPTARSIRACFAPDFQVIRDVGVGVAVPPSYVGSLSEGALHRLDRFDGIFAATRLGRAIADHRLLIFKRSR